MTRILCGVCFRKFQAAYEKNTYDKAKATLQAIKAELRLINESAVNSLEEGFEETLTIQKSWDAQRA